MLHHRLDIPAGGRARARVRVGGGGVKRCCVRADCLTLNIPKWAGVPQLPQQSGGTGHSFASHDRLAYLSPPPPPSHCCCRCSMSHLESSENCSSVSSSSNFNTSAKSCCCLLLLPLLLPLPAAAGCSCAATSSFSERFKVSQSMGMERSAMHMGNMQHKQHRLIPNERQCAAEGRLNWDLFCDCFDCGFADCEAVN